MKRFSSNVRVLDDFASDAARLFADWVSAAVAEREVVHVALAGGTTPKAVYEVLAGDPYRQSIAWASIHFWQGDERPVPADHPDSNWGMACRSLLDVVGVPQAHRHPMRGDAHDLEAAASEYSEMLSKALAGHGGFPVFDLILLGMGTDGHTVSLFPGTAGLAEREQSVIANELPHLGQTRLTLTFPAINAAREVWFLVTGEAKAAMVARLLGEGDSSLPVSRVTPACCLPMWLLDEAAAAVL
jgi:6-phosphogluconolactonase